MKKNYKRIEDVLLHQTLEVVNELTLIKQKELVLKQGFLYTFISIFQRKIIIGYEENSYESIGINKEGYTLIEKRRGSKNESELIKRTLFELGFKEEDLIGVYNYSNKLLYYLDLLGWPTGKLKGSRRIRKS